MTHKIKNMRLISLLVASVFLVVLILVIGFPKKRPLREILPALTSFDRFFSQHAAYVESTLRNVQGEAAPIYEAFRSNPSAAGKRMEALVDAACNENAYCSPLYDFFLQEMGVDEQDLERKLPLKDSWILSFDPAQPDPIAYGGSRAKEIQSISQENFASFSGSLQSLISDLGLKSLVAACEFMAIRREFNLDPDAPIEAIKKAAQYYDKKKLLPAWLALREYCAACDQAILEIRKIGAIQDATPIPGDDYFPKNVLYASQTPYGVILIGGKEKNLYPAGDLFLVIDLGGEDTYYYNEAFRPESRPAWCSTIIDIQGDDLHKGGSGKIATGLVGFKVLLDLEGNDRYTANGMGLGASVLGLGILADMKGNDKYYARTHCLGAAAFGAGFLIDDQGDDIYKSSAYSQGFAGPSGAGILVDASGDDQYCAMRSFFEEEEEPESFSQGCAFSFQEEGDCGLGVLIDLLGDDSYRCENIGQGSALGRGVALLLDGRGYDFYIGRNSCQGHGSRGGVGILKDTLGCDQYIADQRSQGMGELFSLGVLIDDGGDDSYAAYTSSQGDNATGGTGILSDLAGINRFILKQ